MVFSKQQEEIWWTFESVPHHEKALFYLHTGCLIRNRDLSIMPEEPTVCPYYILIKL